MSATICRRTASSRSHDRQRRGSCSGCLPPWRGKTGTTRSSSCSVARCDTASMREHKRLLGRSSTSRSCSQRRSSRHARPTRTSGWSSRRSIRSWSNDEARNQRICDDVLEAVNAGRSPLVLTERNDHLDRLEQGLAQGVRHLVVLRAGMGKKQRQALSDRLGSHSSRRGQGHPGDRQVRWRGFRRPSPGHAVPDAACLVARHDRPVRRPPAPAARQQARSPDL